MRVDVVELFAFVHSWKLTRAYKVWYGSESNLIEQNVEQNCNDAGVGKPTYGVLKRKDFLFLTWAIIWLLTLTIKYTTTVKPSRKIEHIEHDSKARNRLLIFSIRSGEKNAMNKLRQPAPRFANLAPVELRPTDSKIETE